MATVRKREAAKRDLIAQWVWYAENADLDTADRFLRAADSTVSMIAGQPESGYRFFISECADTAFIRSVLAPGKPSSAFA